LIEQVVSPRVKAAKEKPQSETATEERNVSSGHGKIILLGEHAVVYGRHAIATPIPLAIQAHVQRGGDGVQLIIPRWGVEQRLHRSAEKQHAYEESLAIIFKTLGLERESMRLEIFPNVPRAMGLACSTRCRCRAGNWRK
jgi:hydroxymethylglutaryl-CoA reductase